MKMQKKYFCSTCLWTASLIIIVLLSTINSSASANSTSLKTAQVNSLWKASAPSNSRNVARHYPYQSCFKQTAKKYNIPVEILLALARGESNFDAKAKSKSNAYGVMQILWPSTARHLGVHSLSALLTPCINIDAGARYLKELLTRYNGNLHLAMAAYNYGPGRINTQMVSSGMPNGAIWYSNYIYDHYQTIVKRQKKSERPGEQNGSTVSDQNWIYQPGNQLVLLQFNQPYRAKGFVDYLKNQNPSLKIEWFKTSRALYQVVLRYDNKKEFLKSQRLLKKQGFRI